MSERTQKERVKEYLMSGHTITPLEALRKFGAFRLSAIIYRLRGEGHHILMEKIPAGKNKRVGKYTYLHRQI